MKKTQIEYEQSKVTEIFGSLFRTFAPVRVKVNK